jgi:hypothetical protein
MSQVIKKIRSGQRAPVNTNAPPRLSPAPHCQQSQSLFVPKDAGGNAGRRHRAFCRGGGLRFHPFFGDGSSCGLPANGFSFAAGAKNLFRQLSN